MSPNSLKLAGLSPISSRERASKMCNGTRSPGMSTNSRGKRPRSGTIRRSGKGSGCTEQTSKGGAGRRYRPHLNSRERQVPVLREQFSLVLVLAVEEGKPEGRNDSHDHQDDEERPVYERVCEHLLSPPPAASWLWNL